jgi:hypothetical protein
MNETATAPPPATSAPTDEEKKWALFAHLSILVGGLVTFGWAAKLRLLHRAAHHLAHPEGQDAFRRRSGEGSAELRDHADDRVLRAAAC